MLLREPWMEAAIEDALDSALRQILSEDAWAFAQAAHLVYLSPQSPLHPRAQLGALKRLLYVDALCRLDVAITYLALIQAHYNPRKRESLIHLATQLVPQQRRRSHRAMARARALPARISGAK